VECYSAGGRKGGLADWLLRMMVGSVDEVVVVCNLSLILKVKWCS
jgi:hypothetical protein